MFKQILISLCFILFTNLSILGNNEDIERKLKNASQVEKIDLYLQLAHRNIYSDPQRSIKYANEALEFSLKLNNKKGEAEALYVRGLGYYFLSDYDKLFENYQHTLSSFLSLGDKERATGLAATFFRLRQFEDALDNYNRSLKLFKNEGNTNKVIECYRNIGDVYKNLNNYQAALENYLDAFSYINNDDNMEETTVLMGNIGRMWLMKKEYEKALIWFTQLNKMLISIGDESARSAVLNNIGSAHYFLNHLDTAFVVYKEALEMQKSSNDHLGAAMTLLNLGRISSEQGNFKHAKQYLNKSEKLSKIVNAREMLRETYQEMAKLYERQKDFEEAYRYHIYFSEMAETLTLEDNVKQFITTLTIYELEQKQKENEILQAKSDNFMLKLEKESLAKWRLSFGFTILLILILAFVIYYRYFLKREENKNLEHQINKALKKQEEQHQIIVHQASLTSLGELAAGIAHEINQPIQSISLSAESIQYEMAEELPDKNFIIQSVKDVFEDIHRVREIVDHIRIFSSGQKEEVSEKFQVEECVRAAVSMIGRQLANHQISISLELTDHLPVVFGNPHKLEQVILNLMTNARDAVDEKEMKLGAEYVKKIVIKAFSKRENIILEVVDNGIGIDKPRQTDIFLPFVTTKLLGQGTGLGLSISYSIIKEMDGRMEVDSAVNKGTTMRVILPAADL